VSTFIRTIVLILIASAGAQAQVLNSGSNGSDGALEVTGFGVVVFDPVARNIDTDRDNVFHFTSINIGPDVILKMPFNALQGMPVIWLASGPVQIDGTIDLDGQAGSDPDPLPGGLRRAAIPGPGGYPGGEGWRGPGFTTGGGTDMRPGLGPGGGPSLGHGGHAVLGPTFANSGGAAYGNALLVPLRGGSGGGGAGDSVIPGGGGGAGGGALRIFSTTSIAVDGTLTANGGNGGASSTAAVGDANFYWSSAGGGSGGSFHLIAPLISGTGTLSAKGGAQGGFSDPARLAIYLPIYGQLLFASPGRIRLDAVQRQFSGASTPTAIYGTPYNVPLPAGFPAVRVTSIGGIPVSASPTGEAATPDAVINNAGPVAVVIEAKNIPPGTRVVLRVMSEAVADFVVISTPLDGTQQSSTATASVTFPPGFSRGLVRATWNPPPP
jgi:hypothetical protein